RKRNVIFSLSTCFLLNAPSPLENYRLSLHGALPISMNMAAAPACDICLAIMRRDPAYAEETPLLCWSTITAAAFPLRTLDHASRSEEHTSELQSRGHLVCRLLPAKTNGKTPGPVEPA